jgi:hypothetical protein
VVFKIVVYWRCIDGETRLSCVLEASSSSRKSRSLLYNHYKNTDTACSLFV